MIFRQGREDYVARARRSAQKYSCSLKGRNLNAGYQREVGVRWRDYCCQRYGALISSTVPLRSGLKIEIHVIITDKRASAEVVYVDAEQPFVCGIALEKPENIWGLSLPSDDWYERDEG